MVGEKLGQYRILDKLGEGGMGVVYRARDERLDREVAIKVLPSGTLATDADRRQFAREANALARLNHPNVEILYEFDSLEGTDFLVMEFVPGTTLATRIGGHALADNDIVSIAGQIAAALEEAHEQNIIHRDLKPANVGITPKGKVKLLDFGLARRLPDPVGLDATATRSREETVVGTLPYMSPEQVRGEQCDARSDIYSFGTVLYEMATGRRP